MIAIFLNREHIHKHILSHGDYDCMREAINLVNNFKVEKVILNCVVLILNTVY